MYMPLSPRKTILSAVAALSLMLLSTANLYAENKLGEIAVDQFWQLCFKEKANFNRLSEKFKTAGWQEGTTKDHVKISKVIAMSKRATRGAVKSNLYGMDTKEGRLIAVVSKVPEAPVVGCYIYAPNSDYESAEQKISTIMTEKPEKTEIKEGNFRSSQWRNIQRLRPNLSFKYLYAYPHGKMDNFFGFAGISLATTVYLK